MPGDTLHEYRIRLHDAEDGEIRAVVDRHAQTITLELPDSVRVTVDVVTARATFMLLHEAVYTSLDPTGPLLRLERNHGDGWTTGQPTP